MQIEFDPVKNALNFHKHGLPLSDAARLEWDTALTWPDARFDYGEARMCALAWIGLRLYRATYVDRLGVDGQEVRRIISLRKANRREEHIYAGA